MMDFSKIYRGDDNEVRLKELIERIRFRGPVEPVVLEELSHIKNADPTVFKHREHELLNAMGLFYKDIKDNSLHGLIFKSFSETIKKDYGSLYTPVQVDILRKIEKNNSFSFSAPTSAGKSYIIRSLLKTSEKDVVIVVPSRALLSEYINEISNKLNDYVLPLPFIERINRKKSARRVYVVTPERAYDIFSKLSPDEVSLFLFDEAQHSEEKRRGLLFDALVENICKFYPNVKKVFAQPFINNPEAQIEKHVDVSLTGIGKAYMQQSVGKIYVVHGGEEYQWAYFSPYDKDVKEYPCSEDIIIQHIEENKSILIFTSKSRLKGNRIKQYRPYARVCTKLTNEKALEIIDDIEDFIGCKQNDPWKKSTLVSLMKRGIVYHHGSMPLRLRNAIESFVRLGYARICLATPTLLQGINMPFDLVWIENYRFQNDNEDMRTLSLKNLIGRAGRSSILPAFDTGIVVVERKNKKGFSERLHKKTRISDKTLSERAEKESDEDLKEFVDAIIEGSYDPDYKLTRKQVARLQSVQLEGIISQLLDDLMPDGKMISISSFYLSENKKIRERVKDCVQAIFQESLSRSLTKGEKAVIGEAIHIFVRRVNGQKLKGIVDYRVKSIRNRADDFQGEAPFIVKARELPDSSLITPRPVFEKNEPYNYDELVYDTYDYMDKVLSISLSPVINAAMLEYELKTGDSRAGSIAKFMKYGSNDNTVIALTRYGFVLEDMEWLLPCVTSVDEDQIVFNDNVNELDSERIKRINRFR